MKSNVLVILLLCAICASPVTCISRWFSATFNDLKFTLYRYAYCVNGLQPLSSSRLNETEYLTSQIKTFLDEANYDNDQLANVTALMDGICNPGTDDVWLVSGNINVKQYENSNVSIALNISAKANRCRAIDDSLDAMYHVLRRSALNRSEPLDFKAIQFHANGTRLSEGNKSTNNGTGDGNNSTTYGLLDLINTSWIKADFDYETACNITKATQEYIESRRANAATRRAGEPTSYARSLLELIDRYLEPVLGLQKRLYWEGTTRLELIGNRISSGPLGNIGRGVSSRLSKTRQAIFGARNATANSTVSHSATATNGSRVGTAVPTLPPKSRAGSASVSISGKISSAPAMLVSSSSSPLTTALPSKEPINSTLEQ